ncbi:MAG: ATP-dependent helicase HepA, partial [Gammaproteobacteria bacterium]
MQSVIPGQRWINHAQPELGLGTILEIDGRLVSLKFGTAERIINYAIESAPLDRVRFSAGDSIEDIQGRHLEITEVEETDDLIYYVCSDESGKRVFLEEEEVSPAQAFNRPLERLFHGQTDMAKWFQFRYDSQLNRNELLQSHLWGLLGTRTSLLPHQLYVAHEVASRHCPRVLLADEVGLGKTIEAGLITHSQLINERISRVLIVLPESLVHQWLVEMLRRFNLMFSVFDEERCEAMDDGAGENAINPFLDEQLIIVSNEFLLDQPNRLEQACKAGWDMLIVDEAHYLYWGPDGASAEYQQVELLAEASGGVLLLTGTPQQLGLEGHFARLRLLDPNRYYDPEQLNAESSDLAPLAKIVDAIHRETELDAPALEILEGHLGHSIDQHNLTRQQRDDLVDKLLDRYGTGRVMFRNTRASVEGFPVRRAVAHPLESPAFYLQVSSPVKREVPVSSLLTPEILWPEEGTEWWQSDPRVSWLIDWLKSDGEEKALVICAHRQTAKDLSHAMKHRAGLSSAVFH